MRISKAALDSWARRRRARFASRPPPVSRRRALLSDAAGAWAAASHGERTNSTSSDVLRSNAENSLRLRCAILPRESAPASSLLSVRHPEEVRVRLARSQAPRLAPALVCSGRGGSPASHSRDAAGEPVGICRVGCQTTPSAGSIWEMRFVPRIRSPTGTTWRALGPPRGGRGPRRTPRLSSVWVSWTRGPRATCPAPGAAPATVRTARVGARGAMAGLPS